MLFLTTLNFNNATFQLQYLGQNIFKNKNNMTSLNAKPLQTASYCLIRNKTMLSKSHEQHFEHISRRGT